MTPCPITADRDEWRGAVTQADRDLRAAIWNTLGHDLKLGRALTRFGMARFNETVDALAVAHRQQAEASFKAREAVRVADLIEEIATVARRLDHIGEYHKRTVLGREADGLSARLGRALRRYEAARAHTAAEGGE